MTEAELLRLSSLAATNAITSFTVLLSISSAYLVAAYKVGRDLTRSQVAILNSLFTVCSIFFSLLAGYAMSRAMAYGDAAAVVVTVEPAAENYGLAAWWMVAMCALIYFACLKFMMDVRKSSSE